MPAKITGPNDPRVQAFVGKKFNRLTLISFMGMKDGRQQWMCKCDCGTPKISDVHSMVAGHTGSCGCLAKEVLTSRSTIHGLCRRGKIHPLYVCWQRMTDRCRNIHSKDYPDYGGRGISVCERWQCFENFVSDMGHLWRRGLTIERKDNNLGYCPDNCRWATFREQALNKRTSRLLTHDGITLNLITWERRTGISHRTIGRRLKDGWSVSEALTTPVDKRFGPRFA